MLQGWAVTAAGVQEQLQLLQSLSAQARGLVSMSSMGTGGCWQPDGLQQLLQPLLRDERAVVAVYAEAVVHPQPGRQRGRHEVPPVGAPPHADAIAHPAISLGHPFVAKTAGDCRKLAASIRPATVLTLQMLTATVRRGSTYLLAPTAWPPAASTWRPPCARG